MFNDIDALNGIHGIHDTNFYDFVSLDVICIEKIIIFVMIIYLIILTCGRLKS